MTVLDIYVVVFVWVVGSLVSLRDQVVADNREDVLSLSPSTRGQTLGPPEMNETHAYVPYLYARDSIARVMEDMKKMKKSHINIVHEIEGNYRSIEDDTQVGNVIYFKLNPLSNCLTISLL